LIIFSLKYKCKAFLSVGFTLLNSRFEQTKARFFGYFDKGNLLAIILPFVYNEN